MGKTKIYGASDDLIEIEGEINDEHQANSGDQFNFSISDGTKGYIAYSDAGEWKIVIHYEGTLFNSKILSVGDDEKHTIPEAIGLSSYSDILVMESGVQWVKIGRKTYKP